MRKKGHKALLFDKKNQNQKKKRKKGERDRPIAEQISLEWHHQTSNNTRSGSTKGRGGTPKKKGRQHDDAAVVFLNHVTQCERGLGKYMRRKRKEKQ